MNDIDFIKKSVPFCLDFELCEGDYLDDWYIRTPSGRDYHNIHDAIAIEKDIMPLLLIKTIEGINRENKIKGFWISLNQNDITVYKKEGFKSTKLISYCFDSNDIDTAKRSAIEYVLERL